jgi:hypothetical protein
MAELKAVLMQTLYSGKPVTLMKDILRGKKRQKLTKLQTRKFPQHFRVSI